MNLPPIGCVTASDDTPLPLDSLPHTMTYDGSGNRLTDTVIANGHTYTKTMTYTGANMTASSVWVKVS